MVYTVYWWAVLGRKIIDFDDGSDTGDGTEAVNEEKEPFTILAESSEEAWAKAEEEAKKRDPRAYINLLRSEDGRYHRRPNTD